MELKRFTADQAREEYHGEDSFFIRVMNTIYDSIRRKSRNRGLGVAIPCETYKPLFVKRLINAFKEDGYVVEYDYLNSRMIINW